MAKVLLEVRQVRRLFLDFGVLDGSDTSFRMFWTWGNEHDDQLLEEWQKVLVLTSSRNFFLAKTTIAGNILFDFKGLLLMDPK